MNKTMMIGASLLLLAGFAMPVNASHLATTATTADPVMTAVFGTPISVETNWVAVENQLILCESTGLTDPHNANPQANAGYGGKCFVSSQQLAAWPPVAADRPAHGSVIAVTTSVDGSLVGPLATSYCAALPCAFPAFVTSGSAGTQADSQGANVDAEYAFFTDNMHATTFPTMLFVDSVALTAATGALPGDYGTSSGSATAIVFASGVATCTDLGEICVDSVPDYAPYDLLI